MKLNLVNYNSSDSYFKELSFYLVNQIKDIILKRDYIFLIFSGGNTPENLYKDLLKFDIKWDKVIICWSDERMVSVDSVQSSFGRFNKIFLNHLTIKPKVFDITRFMNHTKPHLEYNQVITELKNKYCFESFDIALLGTSASDGHVASIFSNKDLINKYLFFKKTDESFYRVSMSSLELISSKKIIFMTNENKLKFIKKNKNKPIHFFLENHKNTIIFNQKY